MRSKFSPGIIILLVLLGLACWWAYHSISDNRRAKDLERLSQEQLTTFASRYNAITTWETDLDDPNKKELSIQVDDVIVNTGGRPILITKPIDDLANIGGRFFLYVHGPQSTFRFILECTPEIAMSVKAGKMDTEHCAIIARISSVKKADLGLTVAGRSSDESSEDAPLIEADYSSQFYARGQCLAIISIKEESMD